MDEFGVLVESIGFKAQGRSAPMSKLKQPKPNSHFTPTNTSSFVDSSSALPVDHLDGNFFRSNSNNDDDIFGGGGNNNNQFSGVDFESVFVSSSSKSNNGNSNYNSYDDLFGLNENKSGGNVVHDHDDVFGFLGVNSNSGTAEKKANGFDDLLPGFGASNHGIHTKTHLSPPEPNHYSPHPSSEINDDPFLVFEKDAKKSSIQVSLDDLDDFVTGRGHKEPIITGQTRNKTDKTSVRDVSSGFENVDDLLFGVGVRKKHDSKPSSNAQDSQFDFLFNDAKPKVQPPPNTRKYSPTTGGDDITTLFGDVAVSTVEFQEIDDEPGDRRDARFKRYMRMKQRMGIALEEKNQRDLQSQYEQEEKHRLAESLDYDIKRWAAGKEGNLRALLSSLQQVLWPECGWRAVSLTDMITSDSVKKVYKKATLCVHPDKVQQKGANIQQKYIAEKVFDILKEAWNKFSTEELR